MKTLTDAFKTPLKARKLTLEIPKGRIKPGYYNFTKKPPYITCYCFLENMQQSLNNLKAKLIKLTNYIPKIS